MLTSSRRTFLTGLGASLIAAPAIVRFASLMPVRGIVQAVEPELFGWSPFYTMYYFQDRRFWIDTATRTIAFSEQSNPEIW